MLLGQQAVLNNINRKVNAVSKNIDEAYLEVGERGVGNLKRETPVDTGRLRQSMSYTVDKKVYSPLGMSSDNVKATHEKDVVIIGTNTVYAPSVKYRATNGSQGFMLRAYQLTKKQAKSVFEQAIKRGVNK